MRSLLTHGGHESEMDEVYRIERQTGDNWIGLWCIEWCCGRCFGVNKHLKRKLELVHRPSETVQSPPQPDECAQSVASVTRTMTPCSVVLQARKQVEVVRRGQVWAGDSQKGNSLQDAGPGPS